MTVTDQKRQPPRCNTGVTRQEQRNFGYGACCDYLSVSSYDTILRNIAQEIFHELSVKPLVPGKVMQYDALKSYDRTLTYGTAWQNQKGVGRTLHSLLRASGSMAQSVYSEVQDYEFACTRIDLQVTLSSTKLDYDKLFDDLKDNFNCTLIQSSNSTLYVGSRKSDRFVRIYPHRYNDNLIGDRFEIEYKGTRAQLVFDNPHYWEAYVLAEIHRLSKASDNPVLDEFVSHLADVSPRQAAVARKDQEKGLDFYLRVVSPYLRRVIENPAFREVIRYDLDQLDLL